MKTYGKLNLNFNSFKSLSLFERSHHLCFQFKIMVALIGLSVTSLLHADIILKDQYQQKLDQYVAIVNESKKILDEPDAQFTATEQKKALCDRIQAYRGILDLTQNFPEQESALMMGIVATSFLDRQKNSFDQSGMTEQVFCAKPEP